MAEIPKISLPAETIFEIGSFPVQNSHLATFFISIILLFLAFAIGRKPTLIPSKIQLILEMLIGFFLSRLIIAYGSKEKAKKHLPYILTLFLFIFFSNQFSILPLLTSIITNAGTPIFKTPTSHYSLPITLALITIVSCNLIAFANSPFRYIGKFINVVPFFKIRKLSDFGYAFLDFFMGIMDIISELAKIISMSSRLFGNIVAGELIYLIITSLSIYTQFIVPLPFVFLSLASGIIQALVFSMLALSFMAITIPKAKNNLNS